MKTITKLLLISALLITGVGGVKAENPTLNQLEAAYGATSDWTNSLPASYPVSVLDATIFGSDANSQTTNANVNNYDYIYFEVTDFVSERAVRVFFWDPNQNKRLDYYLKPVADKETANYETQTTVSSNGMYCVKIPDGARLQGAKTPWIQTGASEPYFKFSSIYLTERATPYVELVPYTLVWTTNSDTYRATIPILESHIRTTGGVTINYTTGEVNCTGSGSLTIYLNNEDLVGATGYNLVTSDNSLLGSNLGITDAVNGEVGGIYSSRNSWYIANDASRKDRIGAVTALKYNFTEAGSWTITSIYFDADLINVANLDDVTTLGFKTWDGVGADANSTVDATPANEVGNAMGQGSTIYGDGNVNYLNYVDLTDYNALMVKATTGAQVRICMNRVSNGGALGVDETKTVGANGYAIFDLTKHAYSHLHAIKFPWNGQTHTVYSIEAVRSVSNAYYKLSGSGIRASKTKAVIADANATSYDATGVTGSGVDFTAVANPNALFLANSGVLSNANNVIVSGACAQLALADNHPFKAPVAFTATNATYNTTIQAAADAGTLCLPFAATIPEGVKAYTLVYASGDKATATPVTGTISANTPVLLNGSGECTFTGSGAVSASANNVSGALTGVFETGTVPANSYVLQKQGENVGFYKVTTDDIKIKPFRAYLTAQSNSSRISIVYEDEAAGIVGVAEQRTESEAVYDLQGRRVAQPTKGLYIVNGKLVIK